MPHAVWGNVWESVDRIVGYALLSLATRWEARSLSGSGFAIDFDPTWLEAARELRIACAVLALLAYVGRCAQRSETRAEA